MDISVVPVNVWNAIGLIPKPVCFIYSSSQWHESHCFFKKYVSMVSYFTVTDGSGWWYWQRWNCPLFPPRVLSGPVVKSFTELSFYLLTPAAKAHRFSQTEFDFASWTFQRPGFLEKWNNISFQSHLKLLSVHYRVCFSYLRIFVTARTSNEAPAVSDMLRNTFHAIDMPFVWILSHQRMLHWPPDIFLLKHWPRCSGC